MLVIPLQSGSKGNCYYVESGETRFLVDAGISFRQAKLRLESHRRDIQECTAIFLTHDHSDHSRYAGDFGRRLDAPVYVTEKTLRSILANHRIKKIDRSETFRAGESISYKNVMVHSVSTPHDAVDGVAYILESGNHRVGILTDLGHAFKGLKDVLQSLDAAIIESNYDSEMLEHGPYPEFLKRRIRGSGGHLSNEDSARLIHNSSSSRLQWICLCHLSDENNCPEIAIRVHQQWLGDDYPIYVANRHSVSQILQLTN